MNDVTAGPTVLLIDDERLAGDFVTHLLDDESDIRIEFLQTAEDCVAMARRIAPTVVLADLRMPAADGFDVVHMLRACEDTRQLPVVLLSSEDSAESKARAFAAGANDYLVKWPDKRELSARIRYHSRAYLALRERDRTFEDLRRSQEQLLARTAELEQSQAALHQAQKMEALGQLTGGVAHDFNNVLQIVSSNLELLRMLAADQPQQLARIDAAMVGVERGARLASHLLAFARRQPLKPCVVDVRRQLRRMGELLRRAIGEQVVVDTRVDDDLWNVTVDPSQFDNVLLNLAINARDAMNGSGMLHIRAANMPARRHDAYPTLSPERDHVLIEVRDTGCGMPPEVVDRAFDPFFTTKPVGQGTGLGLSMAYGFVKQSGGGIFLHSEPGEGTAVRIFLPRTTAPAHVDSPAGESTVRRGSESVLLVEDEEGVRQATAALLGRLGYRVIQASHAREALEALACEPAIDLLFSDVLMPGDVTTSDFIERARRMRPGLKILLTSGFYEEKLDHVGPLPGQVQLLRKPYSAEALSQAIRQLM